jgi:cytochrome P450
MLASWVPPDLLIPREVEERADGTLVASMYPDVVEVLGNEALFSNDVTYLLASMRIPPEAWPEILGGNPNSFFMWLTGRTRADGTPGRHPRVRGAVARWYNDAAVAQRMADADEVILSLLRNLGQRSSKQFDLVEDYAEPISLWLAAETLGITVDEARRVAEYVHSFARRELKDMLNPEPGLIEEIQAIVERHRKDKGTLLKHLLELAESDRITMGEVISIVFGLIGAGVDTLSAVIASEPILDEFGPDPQTFLVDRNPNEYLSFGLPPSRHFCVGHATAIAVTALASMRLRGQLPSCEFDMEGYHSREQGLVLTVTRAPVRF